MALRFDENSKVGRIGESIRIRQLIRLSRLIRLPDLIALPDLFDSQDLTRLTSWSGRVRGLIRPRFDSTNILVGSSHSDVLMMNFRWSCPLSDFRWSCQWSVRSWLNRRLDSNRVLIQLSRLIRISGLNQFSELTRLPGIDSESTQI